MPPQADLIAEIIDSYYSHRPTFLNAGARAEPIETAIAAVWSQQWPRLRMGFSFRTAQLGSRRRRNARYDVQVAPAEPSDAIYSPSEWSDAAADDAGGGKVTPLRRFLWRYGRDVRDPRDRFRLLVETYLESAATAHLSMTAAARVFDELDGADGAILKNDILGFDTTSLSICPPVSFLDMLRLLDAKGSDAAVDIGEIEQRFGRLSDAEVTEVANFAFTEANRLDQLRDPIFDWTIARADDEIVNSVATSGHLFFGKIADSLSCRSAPCSLEPCHEDFAIDRAGCALDRSVARHRCHSRHRGDHRASCGEKRQPAELCRRRAAAKAPSSFSRRDMEQRQ
jgi:hypothetical protein